MCTHTHTHTHTRARIVFAVVSAFNFLPIPCSFSSQIIINVGKKSRLLKRREKREMKWGCGWEQALRSLYSAVAAAAASAAAHFRPNELTQFTSPPLTSSSLSIKSCSRYFHQNHSERMKENQVLEQGARSAYLNKKTDDSCKFRTSKYQLKCIFYIALLIKVKCIFYISTI